ncbi:hypothetical protein FIU97_14630 [Roseivivax sp. THAF40]|uniref:DUF6441 family protein n=1 Tax=Roseivivax sp. THAF40 TaxID=2587858 RepID=UPI0012684918|nr:DUF6441 family protein [Roseivivax sp. THAF40]QFT47815.1 hypothetical protein FIU97_14630 [Roseivivax sp. THAF40]
MRIEAALRGDLERYMREELADAEKAVTVGVHETGRDVQVALRVDTERGLGRRLSRSWRLKLYPKGQASLGAAAVVYTKAPELVRTFDEGATIRSENGLFLAIPTPAAPARGTDRKRLSPSNFPEARFGPLRYVYVRANLSLLVVDNQRERQGKRGGYARSRSKRALKTGYGLQTVPMFYLVPQVRLKRRLNVKAVSAGASRNLARNIDQAFRRLPRRS